MPTQEQINAANVELQIANDNYAALADQYNKYQKVFQDYANASPETQERAEGLMQDALAKYEQLRLNMYAAEDRIQQAHAAVNRINTEVKAAQEAAAAAAIQARAYWRWRYYGPEVVVETPQDINTAYYTPASSANIPSWEQYRQPTVSEAWVRQSTYEPNQSMMLNNSRESFGDVSQWKWTTTSDYLKNARNWFTTTYMNPNEVVYQSSSRLPWRNAWAKAGRAWTYFTLLGWWWAFNWLWASNSTIPVVADATKYGAIKNQTANIPRYIDNTKYGINRLVNWNRIVPTITWF